MSLLSRIVSSPVLLRAGVCGALALVVAQAASLGAQQRGEQTVLRDDIRRWRESHEIGIVQEFRNLLAIPNTTGDSAGLRRNATAIKNLLTVRGVTATLLETAGGPPVVFGELRTPGAQRTIMLYAHYDGQAVDPKEWRGGAPFTPQLRRPRGSDWEDIPFPTSGRFDPESRLFARGAGDDKAPIAAILAALDALRATGHAPTTNLKFFFEGEEESNSAHLEALLRRERALLSADAWLFCDSPTHSSRQQQVVFGVRGVLGAELTVYGAARAMHSGHYGNWVPNPGVLLAELVTTLRDADGRILVPDFYADVVPPTAAELAAVRALPSTDAALRRELLLGGTEAQDAPLAERILLPGLNVRGMRVGQVEGLATNAIPVDGRLSLDFRLVPKQTPERIRTLVEAHLTARGWFVTHTEPTEAERLAHRRVLRIRWSPGDEASRVSMDQPVAVALTATLDELHGSPVLRVPSMGGSLPTKLFERVLGVPLVVLPIANHDDNQHAKDENLRLQNLWDGIETFAAIMARMERHWPAIVP